MLCTFWENTFYIYFSITNWSLQLAFVWPRFFGTSKTLRIGEMEHFGVYSSYVRGLPTPTLLTHQEEKWIEISKKAEHIRPNRCCVRAFQTFIKNCSRRKWAFFFRSFSLFYSLSLSLQTRSFIIIKFYSCVSRFPECLLSPLWYISIVAPLLYCIVELVPGMPCHGCRCCRRRTEPPELTSS